MNRPLLWAKDEWRAFEFSVADPSAVCYFAVVDEDEFVGVDDEPIGRAALPLRALHNGSIYDASPPGREANTRDATSARTVVTELVHRLKPAERKRPVEKFSRNDVTELERFDVFGGRGVPPVVSGAGGCPSGSTARGPRRTRSRGACSSTACP